MEEARLLEWDIYDLTQAAKHIAASWEDVSLRYIIEDERDEIIAAIDTIRQVLISDEQAEFRRLADERRLQREHCRSRFTT